MCLDKELKSLEDGPEKGLGKVKNESSILSLSNWVGGSTIS